MPYRTQWQIYTSRSCCSSGGTDCRDECHLHLSKHQLQKCPNPQLPPPTYYDIHDMTQLLQGILWKVNRPKPSVQHILLLLQRLVRSKFLSNSVAKGVSKETPNNDRHPQLSYTHLANCAASVTFLATTHRVRSDPNVRAITRGLYTSGAAHRRSIPECGVPTTAAATHTNP